MNGSRRRKPPRPLDARRLEEIALRYVGRYATTRAKLVDYLRRKLRERGWEGDTHADPEALGERFAERGYVDDRAFALSKASSHSARGLGRRRLATTLRIAGVGDADGSDALAQSEDEALEAALRFARRRRIGPFAAEASDDPKVRDKAIASMIRAGHAFDLSRAIVVLGPGDEEALDELRARFSHTDG